VSDDLADDVRAAVGDVLRGHGPRPPGGFDRRLWQQLSDTGFHLLGVPEKIGGSGGGLREFAAVLEETAFHAAAVPLVEAALLAGWLLAQAQLSVPDGLTLCSLDHAEVHRARLSGRCGTPWGRYAENVVSLAHDGATALVVVVPAGAARIDRAENLAGEPRDTLVFDDVPVSATAAVEVNADLLYARGALGRSVQLAGAARAVLESARRHVADRVQFGRPLTRFQAVQQHLAAMAAEAAAMRVSADAAVLAMEDAVAGPAAAVAVAAAKSTASAGAHVVASIGHQLHGALGYSAEHPLGTATTRLWSWREEFGNESHWHDQLAAVVRQGAWWPTVSGGAR
jgi:acyl-CoA dehydrogenase